MAVFIKKAKVLPLYAGLGVVVSTVLAYEHNERTLRVLNGNEEFASVPIASGIKMVDVVNKFFTSDVSMEGDFFNTRIIDGNISLGSFRATKPDEIWGCTANMLPELHDTLVEQSIGYLRENKDTVGLLRDFKTSYNSDSFTVALFGNPILRKST